MSLKTRKWVLDAVEKLPHAEIDKLKSYVEHLTRKSQHSTERFKDPHDLPNTEPKRKPKQILEAINKSHQVTIEDAEALLQSIEEGKIPI